MKTVETTRMELFETWFKVCQQARLNRGFDEYTNWEVVLMTMAFNAALDLLVIKLPTLKNSSSYYDGGDVYDSAINQCRYKIESLNLGIKIK